MSDLFCSWQQGGELVAQLGVCTSAVGQETHVAGRAEEAT